MTKLRTFARISGLMTPCSTQKARVGRVGIWASPLLAAVLLVAFLLLLPLSPPASGDTLQEQLEQKITALEQANARLQSLVKELDTLEKEKDAAAARLADLEAEITDVQNDIDQAEADLDALRIQLENRLVNIYKNGGSWSLQYLEALMVEDNLSAVLDRFEMLTKLADEDEQLFSEVEDYLESSRANKTLLEKKKVEQQAQLDDLVQSEKQLTAKKAQAAAQKRSLQSQITSLNAQIRQAQAASSAAARVRAVSDSANKVYIPPASGSSGSGKYPSSAAEVQAQANFIYKTYLVPRASVLKGEMVMEIWRKYGITPAQSLAVLNAESGMGSLKWGGRLVSEGNNFGCMGYSASPSWAAWPPPISHGKIYVGGRAWMKFNSVADGIEAWGRYIANGLGKDRYRPLMRAGDWTAFANIYYGANVAGKDKYIARVTWAYGMLKRTSAAAGYSW